MSLLEVLTITPSTNFNVRDGWLEVDNTQFIQDEPEAPGALDYIKTMFVVLQQVLATREDLKEVTITPQSIASLNYIPPAKARVFLLDGRLFEIENHRADEDDLVEFINEIVVSVLQHNEDENSIAVEMEDKQVRRDYAWLPH